MEHSTTHRVTRALGMIDLEKIRQREVNRINEESKQEALNKETRRLVRLYKTNRPITHATIKWETID